MQLLRGLYRRSRRAAGSTPARRRPTLEALEGRDLPSGVSFQFQIDDPHGEFNAFPLLRKDLDAAGQVLSRVLGGTGTIQVLVRPDDSIPRASGTCLGVSGVGQVGGLAVEESAPITAARTGVDPNGPGAPEIVINLNAQSYLKDQVWFDPSGAARTAAVPTDKVDFVTVVLHEMLHGCGFTGYRTVGGPNDGQLSGGFESTFDMLTSWGAGGDPNVLYFVGPEAMAVYGGPVPLTSQGPSALLTSHNYYELGNPARQPGADLVPDLMNGVMYTYGTRYTPSKLDLAMLADLGWNVAGFPPPAPVVPPAPAAPLVAAPPPASPPASRRHGPRHTHHGRHTHAEHALERRRHPARERAAANPLASYLLFA